MNLRNSVAWLLFVLIFCLPAVGKGADSNGGSDGSGLLRVGTFHVDASPPIGSPLAYDPCIGVTDPLSLSGIVILGSGDPIVMAAVDWIGVANESHRELRQQMAAAAGTTIDRVTVHALHQHDAPRCDFSAAALLAHHGIEAAGYDVPWARDVFRQAAQAVSGAVKDAVAFDEVGVGVAEVHDVASNRRLMNAAGQVTATRYTATRDPKLRAMPVGTIDPLLRSISLWQAGEPIVVLTYYATHPQSYYRTGLANPDFPGYARNTRQTETGVPHVHFNGAGGNIGAGKWNDGSPENRAKLANRVADAMQRAFEATSRQQVTAEDLDWAVVAVGLPPAEHLVEADLLARLTDPETSAADAQGVATNLAWLRRCQAGDTIEISRLTLGPADILHMPGELFVEYQLAAAAMQPDRLVAMAAYGDYAPGYIGTRIGYTQGGYETSERASRVAPDVETVLVDAMSRLLGSDVAVEPLGVPHDGIAAAEEEGER